MAQFAPEITKAMEPTEQGTGSVAQRAKKLSESIQRRWGDRDKVVGASPFSSRIAQSEASAADIKRRQEFIPKVYEQTAKSEEAGASIQDSLADAYSKFNLTADELAEKQRQTEVGLDLFREQAGSDIESKLREIEFSAFRNKAERDDAMAKAFADGSLNEEMVQAGINGDIKVSDIDTYWKYQLNELNELWKDFAQDKKIEYGQFEADLEAKAAIWGSILNGMFKVGGEVMKNELTSE